METALTIPWADDKSWRNAVVQRLEELVRLDQGWDGYRGRPVSLDDAAFVLRALEMACQKDSPAPQIVPCSNGNVQVEWHTEHGDLELLFRGPYSVRAWYSNSDSAEEEVELTNDFLRVSEWIRKVTEPEIACRAAA